MPHLCNSSILSLLRTYHCTPVLSPSLSVTPPPPPPPVAHLLPWDSALPTLYLTFFQDDLCIWEREVEDVGIEEREDWGKAEEESERSSRGNHRACGEEGVITMVTPGCGGRVQGPVA